MTVNALKLQIVEVIIVISVIIIVSDGPIHDFPGPVHNCRCRFCCNASFYFSIRIIFVEIVVGKVTSLNK